MDNDKDTDTPVKSVHRWDYGKVAVVDRVRGGLIQIKKLVNETKGFKIVKGQLVKMTPDEMRARKRGARMAVRKRKAEKSQIHRNYEKSLRIRGARLS